ncbi:tRNA uridine-5-carboxymethylaminomethyl(34) synthesis GTPase MnmE [Marispirochaeta sp.]|jgi:tRNA modification GTPase|uniref:tRNA uridine-5-carboxymethylaminomethyl(34) synthesis GTPase MnmE n=1 Tax=Marispirochaeta sp. TaxID=2038653 RepID=UPI0029C8A87C|nr:tRNA uridine-5-carboxymethylaminomethyl(34) synthesis GTPase MnmE [Marispirochaeta sp.]
MNPISYDTNDPVVALASPWGESAVAVLRASGKGSLSLLAGCFSRPEALASAASHTLVHGILRNPQTGEAVDEIVCAVYRDGRGYTGEEAVEIFAHGSMPGIQLILETLRSRGFRDARPGEFTLRAFLNGRMDLTRAEAVREIISSRSRAAHGMALHRLEGSIFRRIDTFKSDIRKLLAAVEIQLDYPEDEVPSAELIRKDDIIRVKKELETLASTFSIGRLYQEGARVALSGRTNAGKSSLFNLFVKEDRSIVSDLHGTTRDFVHEQLSIRGIPVTLYDTAGLREAETGDAVEREGIRRSGLVTREADLILYLVDGSIGLQSGEIEGIDPQESILLWNKADIAGQKAPEGFLPISAVTGEGFTPLEEEICRRLSGTEPAADEAVIDSVRQRDLLLQGSAALTQVLAGVEEGMPLDAVAVDLRDALDALGEITGEVTSADVLEDMFSRFCVGK